MSRAYPIEPPPLVSPLYHPNIGILSNSDPNFSPSSAPPSPHSTVNIPRPSIIKTHVNFGSTNIHRKVNSTRDDFCITYVTIEDKGSNSKGVNSSLISRKGSKVPSNDVVNAQNINKFIIDEEDNRQNIPGTVYVDHHCRAGIHVKVINNHNAKKKEYNIHENTETRQQQAEPGNHPHQHGKPNDLLKQDYHNNNMPGSQLHGNLTEEDTNMLSESEKSDDDTNDQDHGEVPSLPFIKENKLPIESPELKENQHTENENESPSVLRTIHTPIESCTERYNQDGGRIESEIDINYRNSAIRFSSIGIQVSPTPQYRLRFLPICGCTANESEWDFCRPRFVLRLIGRWAFSQCGLCILLIIWAILGAASFHSTEGPREEEQTIELKKMQDELIIDLSSDLKKIALGVSQGRNVEDEPKWRGTMKKYVARHEMLLLEAVSSGYGEGGGGGRVWTFAGCVLFAVSLLTTLGFGAPVPRTTLGRIAAVIFAAVGIPLHLLLVLNIGMLVAVMLQNLAGRKSHFTQHNIHPSENNSASQIRSMNDNNNPFQRTFKPPLWLKWFPAISILTYYIYGVLIFGAGRSRPFSACLLFPLDFTAAGGVGLTSSITRTGYAIYLEGAVTLAAVCVSLLQVVASNGLTNLGLKLGLLTNT